MTVPAADAGLVLAKMKGAGVPCARIGTTGGDAISIADQIPVVDQDAQDRVRALATGLYERQGVVSARAPQMTHHSTFVAPGILRNAAVTAQLSATVSTNAMVALTMAGRS